MKENKLLFEVREFWYDKMLANNELSELIEKMNKKGFRYEGINPNNGAYSFIKSNRK